MMVKRLDVEVEIADDIEVQVYCSECEDELQVTELDFGKWDQAIRVSVEPHQCLKEEEKQE